MSFTHRYESPLGTITLKSDGSAITGLCFAAPTSPDTPLPVFDEASRWLDLYFAGQQPDFLPPLAPRGTAFQLAVWHALSRIPYGQTTTYAGLAAQLGLSRAHARAIGAAVARNPILLLFPCHRVLAASGAPSGYAAGPERKAALLSSERSSFS